jgi:hypothetical protein
MQIPLGWIVMETVIDHKFTRRETISTKKTIQQEIVPPPVQTIARRC